MPQIDYFNNIIGQDLAIQILTSAVSKKHLAPAYLFSGPEGVGRKKTAKIFIETLINSESSREDIKRKIESLNHPDLMWIEPLYTYQGSQISKRQVKLENITTKAPPQIRLSQIKKIIEFLGRKPLEAKKGIVIIEDIETMNESAANALLKTLEEPKEGLFILITSRLEKLLATIRSRCQLIPFQRLNDDQVKQIINVFGDIKDIADLNKKTVSELIDFANGSPGLYIENFKYWISIPSSIKDQLNNKLTDPIAALKLAKEITQELSIEEQLWLINFQQNVIWKKDYNTEAVKYLDELRIQILSFVQPRLAWEIALLNINFKN